MYNPNDNRMEPISPELAKKFDNSAAVLTPKELIQRNWTRFQEGETIIVKGIEMYIHEIGESRMILKFKKGE